MAWWKLVLIIAASGAVVGRIMLIGDWFPPPAHWRLGARIGIWVGFAAATAFVSTFTYVVWRLSGQ